MRIHPQRRLALAVLLLLPLASCAKVHQHLLPSDAFHQTANMRSIVLADDIQIRVIRGQSGIGGPGSGLILQVIGKAIDDSMTKSRSAFAAEAVEPLLEATADVDFRRDFWAELEPVLRDSSPWLSMGSFDRTASSLNVTIAEIEESPFLAMSTVYELSPNCLNLIVQTHIRYFLPGKKKPVYFGYFTYFSDDVGEYTHEDAITKWAESGANAYRAALTEATAQMMTMLKIDLLDERIDPKDEHGEAIRLKFLYPLTNSSFTLNGKVLAREGDRVIMRERGGNLFSISTSMTGKGTRRRKS